MSIVSYDNQHQNGRTDEEVRALYEEWLVKHGKSYNGLGEKEKRFQVFKDNLKNIDEHNSLPNRSYKLGLNRFADWTNEQYRSISSGARVDPRRSLAKKPSNRYLPEVGDDLPDSVDRRKYAVVVRVKDEGNCGSNMGST